MMHLAQLLGDKLLYDEPMAKYTAARLGGRADMLYVARESGELLAEVVQSAWTENIPVRVIGGGANILVADAGIRGLVVVNQVKDIQFLDDDSGLVKASAGVNLSTLANRCASKGLSGFEWAVSVPGTLGGAIVNNAGAHGGDMHDCVREVEMIDAVDGNQTLTLDDLAYAYRTSSLKIRKDRRFLILSATLAFTSDDPEKIRQHTAENVAYRKRTQPPGASLGSIFKNPDGDYAGRLIESIGLKGYSIGGAAVSPVHANFFINANHASATDYRALIEYVQQMVHDETGILLETEIELVGDHELH